MYKSIPLSQILSLARAGSPGRAWALFVEEGWDQVSDDPRALTLKGRLLKDQAKAATKPSQTAEQVRLYGEAATAYVAAAKIRTDSYPLINAAALALLGDNPEHSAELAREVLTLIENDPNEGENAYWREATRAEALLLLGREDDAKQSLADAGAELPDAWEDHAATIGQFAVILAKQGRDAGWLDQHRPPSSIHFSGMIRLQPDEKTVSISMREFIETQQPGFAFGALAAGSDLIFAEAFLDNKAKRKSAAEMHVILPFPIEQFRDLSVRPFGDHWLERFDTVLAQADKIDILGLDDPPLALAVEIADQVAMGQAMRNAKNLQSNAIAVTVAGADEPLRRQLVFWRDSGRALTVIEGRREPTSVGEFTPQQTSQSIGTLIWIGNGSSDGLTELVGDSVKLQDHEQGHWFTLNDQEQAYLLAKKIVRESKYDLKLSMLHCIMDIAAPPPELLERAILFARVSRSGILTTDYNSAMALTLCEVAQSIEEIGELKTAWGSQPLWRIT